MHIRLTSRTYFKCWFPAPSIQDANLVSLMWHLHVYKYTGWFWWGIYILQEKLAWFLPWTWFRKLRGLCYRSMLSKYSVLKFPSWLSGKKKNKKKTWLVSTRTQVQSLASPNGLRIRCCHQLWCRSQTRQKKKKKKKKKN